MTALDGEGLLTPGEVADRFRVTTETVRRWTNAGKLGSVRTPGGRRRYREAEVRALLAGVLPQVWEECREGTTQSPR
jgi:excisionase family DNA binding protein